MNTMRGEIPLPPPPPTPPFFCSIHTGLFQADDNIGKEYRDVNPGFAAKSDKFTTNPKGQPHEATRYLKESNHIFG